jgi:hypothetical protein
MGGHVNYHSIIYYLVLLKSELKRLTKEKYQDVIKEICKYEIYPYSDNDDLPNHKDLAKKFNFNQAKMNSILKDLHCDLIGELIDPPLIIKDCVHQVNICLPYDEIQHLKKDKVQQELKVSIWIQMVLPVSPTIGDVIELPFAEQTGMNYRGYVHSRSHRITGNLQEVYLEVHPFHDYYHKWIKMKEDYEDWVRWKERWKKEKNEMGK